MADRSAVKKHTHTQDKLLGGPQFIYDLCIDVIAGRMQIQFVSFFVIGPVMFVFAQL